MLPRIDEREETAKRKILPRHYVNNKGFRKKGSWITLKIALPFMAGQIVGLGFQVP
jgi:hypothetical protein